MSYVETMIRVAPDSPTQTALIPSSKDGKKTVAVLEFELLMKHNWHTREEARRAIFQYIETWYNRKRRHSTLGYVSPAAYEQQLQTAA